jgi:hypothetical protein
MISKKQVERYPLESSPFYRIGRAVDLATVLGISLKEIRRLIVQREAFYNFRTEIIGDKQRALAVPIKEMRALHEKLKKLLGRIMLRDYLYSPRRGRTSIANAEAHRGKAHVVKLDVKQFYPSTTDEHVFQFFYHRMRMAADVAGRLTKLCTIHGRVPFGSPVSPILCALVHNDMFSSVEQHCQERGNTLTVWVDDVTISGSVIQRATVRSISRLAASKRLSVHKAHRARGWKGFVVTGTFVGPKGPSPSNKSHCKMKSLLDSLNRTTSPAERLVLIRSLIGLTNHFLTTFRKDDDAHQRLRGRLMWLHHERRAAESQADAVAALQFSTTSGFGDDDEGVPW